GHAVASHSSSFLTSVSLVFKVHRATPSIEFSLKGEMPSNWLAVLLRGHPPPFSRALVRFVERLRVPVLVPWHLPLRLGCSGPSKTGQAGNCLTEKTRKEPASPGSFPRKRSLPVCCDRPRLLGQSVLLRHHIPWRQPVPSRLELALLSRFPNRSPRFCRV